MARIANNQRAPAHPPRVEDQHDHLARAQCTATPGPQDTPWSGKALRITVNAKSRRFGMPKRSSP